MWNKLATRHRAWEDANIRLLENPALAADLPHWRRKLGMDYAKLSDIERLQLLEFSRTYRGWRAYAWLALGVIICSALGLLAHNVVPHKSVGKLIVAANLGGLAVILMLVVAWFNYRQLAKKPLRAAMLLVVGLTVGLLTGVAAGGLEKGVTLIELLSNQSAQRYLGVLGGATCFMIALTVISLWRNQQYEALTARMQLDAERERSARMLSESQLRLLRAQIEPHFLFNTLGAVQQLAQESSPQAAELTANLIAFLRSSLDGMRRDTMTLREDFALIAAYLQVMQVRMGQRLRYSLDLPEHLAQREVPSMMLLTLAENAVKHGLEPSLVGGAIRISAQQENGMLHLSVCDSGVGLAGQPGNGEGLANIRQRLQLAYGDSAQLALAEDDHGGVIADILLPLERKHV